MSTCRFFIVKGESASKCFQPSSWLWHLREPSFPALMVRCPRDWVLDSESRAHCPPHDSCTQSHWDTEQQTCSQKSSYGCRKQSDWCDSEWVEHAAIPGFDILMERGQGSLLLLVTAPSWLSPPAGCLHTVTPHTGLTRSCGQINVSVWSVFREPHLTSPLCQMSIYVFKKTKIC